MRYCACLQEFLLSPGLSGNQRRKRNSAADTVYTPGRMKPEITREGIEQQMSELARKYVVTHNPEIFKEIYRLSLELEKMRKLEKQ